MNLRGLDYNYNYKQGYFALAKVDTQNSADTLFQFFHKRNCPNQHDSQWSQCVKCTVFKYGKKDVSISRERNIFLRTRDLSNSASFTY